MKIGLFTPLSNPRCTPGYIEALGGEADACGFHSLWVAEHVVLFDEYASRYPYAADGRIPAGGTSGLLEPFTALSFLAACSERVRLGTGICLVPQRNPVYTAKEAAAVDWLSAGRLDFGIGVGWLAEEFAAVAAPFDRRGARCREYVEVMRRLWCDDVSSFHGEFYDLEPCRQFPKPVQEPHPPIHVGGESDAALRRVAAFGRGWYGFNLAPGDVPGRIRALSGMLERRGRRRDEVEVSVCPYLQPVGHGDVGAYRDAGVDQLILLALPRDEASVGSTLHAIAEQWMPAAERAG